MKKRNKITWVNITILLMISVLYGTAAFVFGQPKIEDFSMNSAADSNRAIFIKSEPSNSFGESRLIIIIGTNKGKAMYATVNIGDSLSKFNFKPFTLTPQTSGLVRSFDFTFDPRGYLLTSDGVYALNSNSPTWSQIAGINDAEFTRNRDSVAELWGMSFVNKTGRVCLAGVYFIRGSDDIGKELLLCTNNIFEDKPRWDTANVKRKDQIEQIQLTDIYFDNNQGWAVGTDGVNGVILSSKNSGKDWEFQNVSIKQPLLNITGSGGKIFAVGYNGTIFSKEISRDKVVDNVSRNIDDNDDRSIKLGDIVEIKGGVLGDDLPDFDGISTITKVIGIVEKVNGDGTLRIRITDVTPQNFLELVRNRFKQKDVKPSQVIRIGSAKLPKPRIKDDDTANNNSDKTILSDWKPVPVSTKETLRSIKFSDDGSIGFIAGNKGTILYTKDNGKTWQNVQVASLTPKQRGDMAKTDFYSIFIDKNYCWVVGSNGAIVRINMNN